MVVLPGNRHSESCDDLWEERMTTQADGQTQADFTTRLCSINGDGSAAKQVFRSARDDITEEVINAAIELEGPAQHRFLDMLVVKDDGEHRHTPQDALRGAQEFQQQHRLYWNGASHG